MFIDLYVCWLLIFFAHSVIYAHLNYYRPSLVFNEFVHLI